MRDYLAAVYSPEIEPKLKKLLAGKLISEKEAETIRKSDDTAKKKVVIRPTKWMYWNVHVDGLEFTHDLIVEREGVFKECVEAIKMAKIHRLSSRHQYDGLSSETDVQEIEDMFKYLSSLEVDGHTISPGYDYDAAKKDMVSRLGKDPKQFFLTRDMTRQKFAKIEQWGKAFTIFGTPVYQEFLAGKRELTCTAWAIPTFNVKGWKAPCYLMTDGHYGGYQEMLRESASGKNTASSTASRATRAANIAWCIAATTPAARSARITSAATTGKTSNTTSARNRNRFHPRPNWRSARSTA